MSRIQTEFQGPLIERSLRILERRSQPFWCEGLDGPPPLPPPELGSSELKGDYVTAIGRAPSGSILCALLDSARWARVGRAGFDLNASPSTTTAGRPR